MPEIKASYDGLVIGGGIAGMQAALDLAEQGLEVLLVETQPSIGGIMVGLNKVFPTLDCSSCICTPRMAETSHHDRITLQTYADVTRVEPNGHGFTVQLVQKPRYVVAKDCTGCRLCELACPVDVPSEFDYGLGARRAIYIQHTNAIPQVAVLDVEHCTFCGKCEKVCPTKCIDFTQLAEEITVDAGAVIVASGLKITPLDAKKEYGGGRLVNVMSPLEMERAQNHSGPYGHTVVRPGDGKIPRRIAYVQCAGSRDQSIGIPYCSRVCCMYALKQALLLKSQLPEVEIVIYYMDIRAFGKGYEQFYRRVENEGVKFIKGKVAKIEENAERDPIVSVELLEGSGHVTKQRFDLVVLSQGLIPGWRADGILPIGTAEDGFFASRQPKVAPTATAVDGIYIAGVSAGPKDIPDAIVEAGSAAMQAANYIMRNRAAAPAAR